METLITIATSAVATVGAAAFAWHFFLRSLRIGSKISEKQQSSSSSSYIGGLLEKWYVSLHHSGNYNNFAMSALFEGDEAGSHLSPGKGFSQEQLQKALIHLLAVSPRCRMTIPDAKSGGEHNVMPVFHIVGNQARESSNQEQGPEKLIVEMNISRVLSSSSSSPPSHRHHQEETATRQQQKQRQMPSKGDENGPTTTTRSLLKLPPSSNDDYSVAALVEVETRLATRQFKNDNLRNDDEWKVILEEEMQTPFETGMEKSLFRIHYVAVFDGDKLKNHAIIIAFHHAVADGMTGAFVLKKFLEGLEDDDSSSSPSSSSSPTLLSPPLCSAMDVRPSVGYVAKRFIWEEKILKGLLPRWIQKYVAKKAWVGDYDHLPATREARVCKSLYFVLDDAAKLAQQCRKRKTTVHAALLAAAFCASTAAAASRPVFCGCGSDINLRKYCLKRQGNNTDDDEASREKMEGIYISSAHLSLLCKPSISFWSCAQHLKQQQQDQTPYPSVELVGLSKFIDVNWEDFHHASANKTPSGRSDTLLVSNLGRHEFAASYGNIPLQQVWFTAHKAMDGPLFLISTITVCNRLTIFVNYVEGTVSPEQARRFHSCLQLALNRAMVADDFQFADVIPKAI